jgi:hypothetical protein
VPHNTRQQLDELDALLQRMLELPVQSGEAPGRATANEPRSKEAPAEDPIRPRQVRQEPPPAAAQEQPGPTAPPAPERSGRTSEEWVPLRSTWQPSAQTWGPLAQTWRAVQERQVEPEPGAAETAPPPREPPPARPVIMPRPEPRSRATEPAAPPAPSTETPPDEVPEAPNLSALLRSARTAAANRGALERLWDLVTLRKPVEQLNQVFDLTTEILFGPLGRWLARPTGRTLLAWLGFLCLVAGAVLLACDWLDWT